MARRQTLYIQARKGCRKSARGSMIDRYEYQRPTDGGAGRHSGTAPESGVKILCASWAGHLV